MNLFAALRQRRQPAQGFGQTKAVPEAGSHQTFILEPILTPSGLVDVGEDIPEVADLDIDLNLDADTEEGFDPVETDPIDGEGFADEDLEEIPFIENLEVDFQFESGYFTVGESGEVTIDYLFDGGEYQGELAIFSLEGMELLEPGSEEFIQMAAERAVSNTEQGYIVISDKTEGARFNSSMSGELSNWNSESYQGAKTFQMKAGDTFGFMLVPKGEISEVAANPAIDGAKTPLFSLATSNPDDMLAFGQIADVFGDGNTFVLEDMRVDGKSDLDYNDIIFRVKGATGYTALLDDVLGDVPDWRYTELGQRVLSVDSEFDNPGKEIAGLAAYPANPDPLVPINPIPQAGVDQGGDGLSGSGDGQLNRGGAWSNSPTELSASYVNDIIDQVGSQDALDLYQVKAQELDGSQVTILQGETRVAFLSSDGNVIGEQVLGRGVHTLDLPDGTSGEVTLRFAAHNGSDATYMLSGFESQNPEPFNIDVEFADGITTSQRQIIQQAIRSIEALIVAGSPSAIVDGKIIDDVKFKMSVENLDGNGGTLARTKIDFMRYASLLPAQSLVQFDADDLARLEAEGKLFNVVQHELLHGLGFGNLWEAKGLVDFAGTPVSRYTGEQAVEKLKELGGQTDYIDLERSGEGSADLHWHEGLFQDELMTADLGFLLDQDGKPYSPMSPITLASLADLGYEVNWDQADNNWGLGGSSRPEGFEPNLDELSEEARAGLAAFAAELEELKNSQPETPIAPILDIDPVDPTTISPEIWAHAERFDKNGEYYDWELITIPWGATTSQYVYDRMTHPSKLDSHSSRVVKANDPDYWQFVVDRNRAFGIVNPHVIYAGKQMYLPVWNANYEQEQEEERKRREKELQEQLERERIERERQEELYRQSGSGGLDWYLSKPLPDFGQQAPFETSVRDVVGSVVPDDYFRFTVSRTGWVTVYLADLLADADLYLYDSRNRLIGQATRDGVTDEKIITQLQPGTYLVRVNSSDGKATDYDLKVRFDGLQTRTQSGGRIGGRGPLFSDPRIQRIYDTALENFAAPERAKANARIADLQAEKRRYEREMDALLAEMNAAQRAKVLGALDGARHEANIWVDDRANPIRWKVDELADSIINKANSIANSLDSGANWLPNWPWDARGEVKRKIHDAKNAVIGGVNSARDWLKGKLSQIQESVKSAVWHFIETIKNSYRTGAEINQAIANAANSFRNAVSNAVRGANDLVNQFKGRVLGAADWAKNISFNAFGLSFSAYEHVIKPAVNAISGGVSSAINGMGNVLNGVANWLEPRTQKVVAAIVDALFGDKTGHLWNKIHGVDDKIAATRTELERKITNKARELQSQLNDFLGKLGTDGKKVLDTILNFANSPAGQIGIAVIEVLLGLIPGVGQALDIKDTVIALNNIFIQGKKDVWEFVGLIGALAGWVPGVGDVIKSITKIARKGVDSLATFLKKFGPDVTSSVIKAIGDTNWGQLLRNLVSSLQTKWNEFKRGVDGTADWVIDGLGLRPAYATANNAMLSMFSKTDEVVEELTPTQIHYRKVVREANEQSIEITRKTGSLSLRNQLDFPNARVPGTSLKYPGFGSNYEAHHLIPVDKANNSPLVKRAYSMGVFDIDSPVNGIFLPRTEANALDFYEATGISLPIHRGSHPGYSEYVEGLLDERWDRLKAEGKEEDSIAVKNAVENLAYWLSDGFVEGYIVNDPTIKWLDK
jgi:hypothetical protein